MKAIEKILVVADPTKGSDEQAQRAVKRGFALALQTNAELQLFVVCDDNEYLKGARSLDAQGLEEARRDYSARKRAWLHGLVSSLGTPSVRVSIELAWDRPRHEGITRQVLRYQPDLVIKDTHHHPAISRALFTNTDWHLIRECPTPLLLVRADAWPGRGKVLAAVDPLQAKDEPAALDRKILDAACAMAQVTGGELHVVHVFEPMVTVEEGYVPIAFPVDEFNRSLRAQHRQAVHSLIAGLDLPEERVHLPSGSVRDELVEVARDLPAALVVMGAIARTGLRRVFLGSTAEQVLEAMPCDVLIVKPDGFERSIELYEQEPLPGEDAARRTG